MFTDKDYDLTIVSHTEPNDIDIYSRKDYYFNYDNPAFDKVIDELNLTSDEAKRKELLKQAQKILADDAVDRLPVRAAEDRRLGRQARGPVGERADPGERSDQGEVERSEARWIGVILGEAARDAPCSALPASPLQGERSAAMPNSPDFGVQIGTGTPVPDHRALDGRCPAWTRGLRDVARSCSAPGDDATLARVP